MARYLFAAFPVAGHVTPGLPLARELVRRGHDVRWYTTPKFAEKVEAAGAKYVPYKKALILDEARIDEVFPERAKFKGVDQLKWDMKHVFIDQVPTLLEDLTDELTREPADIIVGDAMMGVCGYVARRFKLPWAVYGISALTLSSCDTPPFGLGLAPSNSPIAKLRDRFMYWMVENVVFKDQFRYNVEMSKRLGFGEPKHSLLDFTRGADLYLQGSTPGFEYPRSDLPQTVKFIGAFLPGADPNWQPPSWWHRLDGGKPVVLLTQGTIATEYEDLILPAIRALADKEVLVIATTGNKPTEALGLSKLPGNVIVEQFVPYAHLMPKTSLLVTNGGYGTVQIALAHGVPIAAFGATEEKPDVAARVQWSGVGLGYKTPRAKESQILGAVNQILGDSRFKTAAERLQQELAQYDAPRLAGDALEALA